MWVCFANFKIMRQALPKAWKQGKTNTVPSPWYLLQDASVFFFLGWEWHAMTVCLSEIQCFIARACWLKHCDCQGATKWVRATFSPPDQCFELFWASNNQYNQLYMYVNATFVCMGHMCIIVYICLFHVWLIHLPNTKASPKFEKKTTTKNPAEQRRAFSTMRKSSASQSACSTVILALQPLPPMPGRSSKITEKPFLYKGRTNLKAAHHKVIFETPITWMVHRMSFHVILMATNEKTCVVHQLSRNYYSHSRIAPYV